MGNMSPGLRELKKQRTRSAIQEAALDLIDRQGYDATTCEQIAAAAEVSGATFFRYFPTKEDVVLTDDYDPMITLAITTRPRGRRRHWRRHDADSPTCSENWATRRRR